MKDRKPTEQTFQSLMAEVDLVTKPSRLKRHQRELRQAKRKRK